MHKLYELKEKLMNELEGYAENGRFSKDDAEAIKALSASVEHIDNICEAEEDGMSYNDGMSYRSDGMGGSYARRGRSYARGRMNAPRDSMGRYSGRYSRADGDAEEMRRELDKLRERIDQM